MFAGGVGGEENEEFYLMGIECQFFEMKRVLEMEGGDGCTAVQTYFMTHSIHFYEKFTLCVFYYNF